MRYHSTKKVAITDSLVHVNYAERSADGKYVFREMEMVVSNPQKFAEQYNTGNCRVLDWQVINTVRTVYKVDKNELESFIRSHGVKVTADDDDDDETEVE